MFRVNPCEVLNSPDIVQKVVTCFILSTRFWDEQSRLLQFMYASKIIISEILKKNSLNVQTF